MNINRSHTRPCVPSTPHAFAPRACCCKSCCLCCFSWRIFAVTHFPNSLASVFILLPSLVGRLIPTVPRSAPPFPYNRRVAIKFKQHVLKHRYSMSHLTGSRYLRKYVNWSIQLEIYAAHATAFCVCYSNRLQETHRKFQEIVERILLRKVQSLNKTAKVWRIHLREVLEDVFMPPSLSRWWGIEKAYRRTSLNYVCMHSLLLQTFLGG